MSEPIEKSYYESKIWKLKRRERLDFAENRCELCNSRFELQVHHSTYARFPGNELLQDLIVLCRPCHEKFHEHKDAMSIARRWIETAFKCGVLYATKANPPAHNYGLFKVNESHVVLRPIDFATDGFQNEANKLANRVAIWIRKGMPGIPDYETHKRELKAAKEYQKKTRAALRRRTSIEIWFEEFEPRIRELMGQL